MQQRGMTTLYVSVRLAEWLRAEAARRNLSVTTYLSLISAMPGESTAVIPPQRDRNENIGRPRRGSASAMRAYLRDLVLVVLLEFAGAARTKEVLDRVYEIARPHALPELLKPHGKYRSVLDLRTAFERKNLQISGYLDATEHGVWRLTDLGLEAAKRLKRLGEPRPPKS